MLKHISLQYLAQLPLFLVWIVGIILALRYKKWSPKASTLVLITLLLFIGKNLIFIFLSGWLTLSPYNQDINFKDLSGYMTMVHICSILLDAVFWSLLLKAIFIGRRKELEISQ